MLEKQKRKRGERIWRLNLALVIVILAALMIMFSFLSNTVAPEPYETAAWVDPFAVCSNQWSRIYTEADFEAYLVSNVPSLNNTGNLIQLNSISKLSSQGNCADGNEYNELSLTFSVYEGLLRHEGTLGDFIAEMVQVIDESNYAGLSTLKFSFNTNGVGGQTWRLDYSETRRAVAAGLTGMELWAIGQ